MSAGLLGARWGVAAVITIPSNSVDLAVSSVGTSGNALGSQGYYFFDPAVPTAPSNTSQHPLSSGLTYASPAIGSGVSVYQNGNAGYTQSTLAISGTTYETGFIYSTSNNITLATITLSGTVPQSFQLGILGDNNSSNSRAANFTVSDNNGGSATTAAASAGGANYYYDQNDFYLVDIAGASAGDVISVVEHEPSPVPSSGWQGGDLGGFTFDPVPEPATLGLMSLAGIPLLRRRRP